MQIIDKAAAREILLEALSVARTDAALPITWTSHARTVFALDAMTWTPALATLLLAKATNDEVDTLSLKIDKFNPASYSARGLCHEVIVPAAVDHGFSIRNTGREPMNNQPFFRYERIDRIERTRNPSDQRLFLEVAQAANELDDDEAFRALAAFLRVALAKAAAVSRIVARTNGLDVAGVRAAVQDFLRPEAKDRPHRLQAFAAACVELMQFSHVRTRRVNDPSRDFPGDVQAISGGAAILALEVRGKTVSQAELVSFVRHCTSAGVHRAILFVDAPGQNPLNAVHAARDAGASHILTATFESAVMLLEIALLWSNEPLEKAVDSFTRNLSKRLREIEASVATLEEWSRAVAIAGSR